MLAKGERLSVGALGVRVGRNWFSLALLGLLLFFRSLLDSFLRTLLQSDTLLPPPLVRLHRRSTCSYIPGSTARSGGTAYSRGGDTSPWLSGDLMPALNDSQRVGGAARRGSPAHTALAPLTSTAALPPRAGWSLLPHTPKELF